jgi:phosphopantetheinyl transferase (holo-ACP synthase)
MTYPELRLLKYRLLITILFLTLCSLAASCQITKVDSSFLISRDYAEFVAAKFDSLDAYKLAHKECVSKALKCDSLLYQSELFISDLKEQYNMQSDMLKLKDAMIQSYERGNVICNDYAKQIKKQTRLKKVWKITAISFISLSVASFIYIAI